MKIMLAIACAASLWVAPVAAGTTGAQETYDLLFRDGTLDALPRESRLVYARDVTNSRAPDNAERNTGRIELTIDGSDDMARLRFHQGESFRNMGSFPASVGNPMIMVFVESVVRDMAETAGGSPFYIRNRVKEALVRPAETEEVSIEYGGATIAGQSVTLHPFDGDPNAARMSGFGDLALTVTMSDQVPGWYHSLRAQVPGDDGTPLYQSTTTFDTVEAGQ
ncbi:hypothetical protein [Actibacterium ureilyticum]|uniref:hypothetical protein n=1 Tax=Actibacterium ureilyticum TaxID=1590614 RepID=UPI000BAAFA11|nr:hypothetical protein [Actibacterium ureilyticum]